MKKTFAIIFILLFAAGCGKVQTAPNNNQPLPPVPPAAVNPPSDKPSAKFVWPIANASSRITKKSFGTYVTPQNSPVSPEKFKGYHTAVDFETTDEEKNIDVAVNAVCDGKLILKKYATGFGGVAVESCILDGNPVTIIYGHLRFASIKPKIGDTLKAGDDLAVLGTGYSSETSGERKHLHLGIHKGPSINILGYVQNKADLLSWIDPQTVLK